MNQSHILYQNPLFIKITNNSLSNKIIEVFEDVKDLLNTRIPTVFPDYTLHNVDHSLRCMKYMEQLSVGIDHLSQLEIALLVYSALLHDIGMAVSEDDIRLIKTGKFSIKTHKYEAMLKIKGSDQAATQEIIRSMHGKISAKFIREHADQYFKIPGMNAVNFSNELALICESHCENYNWIKNNLKTMVLKGNYKINLQYLASILRLADILDIDSQRTPPKLFNLITPTGISKSEWLKHYTIENTEKIEFNPETNLKKIVLHGTCKSPGIHRKISQYCDWIDEELKNAYDSLNHFQEPYKFPFEIKTIVNIQTEGYTYSCDKLRLDFTAITALLMGDKIYGHKNLGLRELIQNSIDACNIRREIEESEFEAGCDLYLPKISVIINKSKDAVVVKDNGIGMSLDILRNYFLSVGTSYYSSNEYLLEDYSYKPIGNFGIGFLSCFMLSNKVNVKTRMRKSRFKYIIELEKGSESASISEIEDLSFTGTEIQLQLGSFLSAFENNEANVLKFLKQYFITEGFELSLINLDSDTMLKISNGVEYQSNLRNNQYLINLSRYDEEINGYALIKHNRKFVSTIDDIDLKGIAYSYNDTRGLILIDDKMKKQLNKFLIDDTLNYYDIPLVIDESDVADFESALKFTDGDIDEVISKFDSKLVWISVIIEPETEFQIVNFHFSERDDYLFDKLSLDNLVKLGHYEDVQTKAYFKSIKLYPNESRALFLPYGEECTKYKYFISVDAKRQLYIRNVYIKDHVYRFSNVASIFEIEAIKVNIYSRKFIPDISRNKLSEFDVLKISNLVSIAIHQGALENFKLSDDEKISLTSFINHLRQKLPNKRST